MHRVHGCGCRSMRLLAYGNGDQEAEKGKGWFSAHFLPAPPLVFSHGPGHGMVLFTVREHPYLLLHSGKVFSDITKPKVCPVNTLGISKSNPVVTQN